MTPSALAHIRPDLLAAHAYAVPDATGLIKLDAMENPYPLPPELQAELAQVLAQVALNRYPVPTYAELTTLLREYAAIPADAGVILGNGSDELIALLAQAVSQAKQNICVLAPAPSFVMYRISAELHHLQVVDVPLATDDFGLDAEAWVAAIETHQPALVYLPFPNNPTGNAFDEAAMRAVISATRRMAVPAMVIVDEAYQPFAQQTWMGALAEFDNLLVMRTVSKLGLAGIRLGYMAGHSAIIAQLHKARPPYNVNVLTEAAACCVLRHADVLEAQAAAIRAARAQLLTQLRAQPQLTVYDTAANFVLVRVHEPLSADAVFAHMKSSGVLVKNLSHAHPSLHNCLRITISTLDENHVMLAALGDALQAS